MTLEAYRADGREVSVVGLGRSGLAAARLLRAKGIAVYASDARGPSAAKEELEALGVAVDLGWHDDARIARSQALILSPGVPPMADVVVRARGAGVPIRAEVDLGLEALGSTPYIAVTGTNGKTTTTALVAHLLAAAGHTAIATGNIGTPVSAVALADHPPAWMAVELSSFQLHDCEALHPAVGVLTNLAPDHLDRYPSLAEYYGDKARLFRRAHANSCWVTEATHPDVDRMLEGVPGQRLRVSVLGTADGWYDRGSGWLMLGGEKLLPRQSLGLLGDHNVLNALMASLAVQAIGVAMDHIGNGLRTFTALAHRLEPIREVGGVLWINDSKATNLASTAVAVTALDQPFVLLLGGTHKGEPYTALAERFGDRCRAVIAYGEAAPLIQRDLDGLVPVIALGAGESAFADVLIEAQRLVRPGDAVLLSPACSSYDMFKNYEERGNRFRMLVEAM